jgi:hypothetical protein
VVIPPMQAAYEMHLQIDNLVTLIPAETVETDISLLCIIWREFSRVSPFVSPCLSIGYLQTWYSEHYLHFHYIPMRVNIL